MYIYIHTYIYIYNCIKTYIYIYIAHLELFDQQVRALLGRLLGLDLRLGLEPSQRREGALGEGNIKKAA